MEQQTKDHLVLATKIIVPLVITSAATVFVVKVIKEIKVQLKQARDEVERMYVANQKATEDKAALLNDKLKAEEALRVAVFDDVDSNGNTSENAEFKEMQKRFKSKNNKISSTAMGAALINNKEEMIHHNAWDENPSFDINAKKDRPITEQEIEAKRREMQSKDVKIPETVLPRSVEPIDDNEEEIETEVEYREEGGSIEMKYDPNSQLAWQAYKNMLLIDIDDDVEFEKETLERFQLEYFVDDPGQVKAFVDSLFQFDVAAKNEYDHNIISDCMDTRIEFFGHYSKFTENKDVITFAEVLIYWMNKLQMDFDGSNLAWMVQMLSNLDLFDTTLDGNGVTARIEQVMSHHYVNNGKFGLFGLNSNEAHYDDRGNNARMWNQYTSYVMRLSEHDEGNTNYDTDDFE